MTITETAAALDARHIDLVAAVGVDHRIGRHVEADKAFDAEHPFADSRRKERHLEALDAQGVRETGEQLRGLQVDLARAHADLSAEWTTAATALTEAERLERLFTPTQLTWADRQTAKILDETRQSNFRSRLATSSLPEVERWYQEAVTREDTPALRFLEEQAARRFPTARREHPHTNALVMGRVMSAIDDARVMRVITARPDLVPAREKLSKIQTEVTGIVKLRELTPAMSFDKMRVAHLTRTEQATRRQRESLLTA